MEGACFYTILMCINEDVIRPEEEPLKYEKDVRDMWTLPTRSLKVHCVTFWDYSVTKAKALMFVLPS